MQKDNQTVTFHNHTSGDLDGVHISFQPESPTPSPITVKGTIGGYVKVGDPLAGNPHKPQPSLQLEASREEVTFPGEKSVDILEGCELFVRIEAISDVSLPVRVQGSASFTGGYGEEHAIYFVGRQSPVFC